VSSQARHTHRYRVCGLHIGSAIPFPELPAVSDAGGEFSPDIELEVGSNFSLEDSREIVLTMEQPDGSPWLTCTRTHEGYRFHFPELADFLIDRQGRHVTFVAQPKTAPETIRHLFLDQVIPPLLNLRGREALHASAIQTASGACAFIGPSGRGKSTLAAAFHMAGYPVLSDDCLLLKDDPDRVLVEPAYPGLRLWDDGLEVVLGNTRSTLPVSHYTSKRRVSMRESDVMGCLPLRRVYLLVGYEEGDPLTYPLIEPLSMRDAFMALVECAFRLDLTDQAMILRQMRVLERVAKEVPVKRLRIPEALGMLPAARELILQDLRRD